MFFISIPLSLSLFLRFYGYKLGYSGSLFLSLFSFILLIISSTYLFFYILTYNSITILIKSWIVILNINIPFSFYFYNISIYLLLLILIISFVVFIYSYWYIPSNFFLSLLYLFLASMLLLILSDHPLLLFIGWEGIGLISFLLIGYWNLDINNSKSSFKSLLYNKFGDILLLHSFILYNSYFDNWLFYTLLFISAIIKSAQIFSIQWLKDAMSGPTPVSSLFPSSTMVTAGIYLLIKFNFNYYTISNIISLLTLLLSGLSSLFQYDLKKIIAFSTTSQLSLLLIYPYSTFHLITHGFYKSLLFLIIGIIIHNSLNEQDIRNINYINSLIFLFLSLSSFSLFSLPPLSGFFSKESILINLFFYPKFNLSLLFLLGTIFTFSYSFKLISHINISPIYSLYKSYHYYSLLLSPLIILYISALFLGNLIILPTYYIFNYNILSITFILLIFILLFKPIFNSNFYKIIWAISSLFNKFLFFDYIFSSLFFKPLYKYSYLFFLKFEKGLLEIFGPIGFFRLILIWI